MITSFRSGNVSSLNPDFRTARSVESFALYDQLFHGIQYRADKRQEYATHHWNCKNNVNGKTSIHFTTEIRNHLLHILKDLREIVGNYVLGCLPSIVRVSF